ncbi:hypothetical protein SAMN02910406_03610 [Ruminococcus albus]|uniref:Uncharacterized protein n=1 Tax=Ruminococcus albus TaxID=1264 RepID=A0A1I1RC97_RUMAL|nr:hypothetical protein SAMN02910406_03610 [Ruminococcus albus]
MIFRFAIDSIINYLRQSFMTTLLLIISIMLIIFSTMIRVGHDYVYRSVDEFFSNGADNTVILRIELPVTKQIKGLQKRTPQCRM